jgi:O-antigen/teichoic acid export membrane protein
MTKLVVPMAKRLFDNSDNQQLLGNVVGSLLVKGFACLIGVATIPVYLQYFDSQMVLGIWFTLISIVNWIFTFDLGIGNGLRNNLVVALAENNALKVKKYITSAYVILGILSFGAGVIGWQLIGWCNWNLILHLTSATIANTRLIIVMRIVFCGVILQFWLRIITSILYAMQKTAFSNSLTLISSLLILVYLLFGKSNLVERDLENLALIYGVALNLPLLLATMIVFATSLKQSFPDYRYYERKYARQIIKLGGRFFIVQLSLLIISATNQMLITWFYGAGSVVAYQIYDRLFYLFVTFYTLVAQPVWSAVTKACAEGRLQRVVKLYQMLNRVAFLGSCGCSILVVLLQPVVNTWLGAKAIQVNVTTGLAFAILSSCLMFINSSTCVANGLGRLRCQMICTVGGALLKSPLVWLFANLSDNWVGVVWANVLVLLPLAIAQPFVLKNGWVKI